MFDIFAICLVLTALLAYLNRRFIGLPSTIGVMMIALLLSAGLQALNAMGVSRALHDYEVSLLKSIDFSALLMQGMLSVLLFAGALHIDLQRLRNHRWHIALLAVLGTLTSTLLVGTALWYVLPLFNVALPFAWCMVFGALISPTDPIAVLGILSSAKAPESLETVICGESLFNDGVGVVLFVLIASTLGDGAAPSWAHALKLTLQEAGGGVLYGLLLGYVGYLLLASIDSYEEEILITLAIVIGGYAMAGHLHVSGPLAMVVAGLIIGNQGRAHAMSEETRVRVDMFWELLDAILNVFLFVLLGLEIVLIDFNTGLLLACLAAIGVTLVSRLTSVSIPMLLLGKRANLPKGSWQILTWGGLRGGISVALALSLPAGPHHQTVLTLTYGIVVFSILVQGLTVGPLVRRIVHKR